MIPSSRKPSDFQIAVTEWQRTGDPKLKSQIAQYLKPTVSSALQSFAGGDRHLTIQAYKLAFDALKKYDAKVGADPGTFVYHNMQRLNRIRADRKNMIHIPENVLKESSILHKGTQDFIDNYGHDPSDDELADYLGMSPKRIGKIRQYNPAMGSISYSSSLTEEGEDHTPVTSTPDKIYLDYLYKSSSPMDQRIIEYATGYNGNKKLSNSDIAAKLHISNAAVSQHMNQLSMSMNKLKGLV